MSSKELIGGNKFLSQLRTNTSISQTSLDFSPTLVINHMVSKPSRVPIEPVLFITFSGDVITAVRPGDDESEDKQNQEEGNEDGHATEVESKEGFFVTVSADEAGEGDKEDEEAEQDDRPPDEVDTGVVGLLV